MKKRTVIIFTLLLLLPFSQASAQKKSKSERISGYQFTPGSDISLSIGSSPLDMTRERYHDPLAKCDIYYYPDWTFGVNIPTTNYLPSITDMFALYGDTYHGPGRITGSINFGYTYKFVKWFELTGYANYSGYYQNYYDNRTKEKAFSANTHCFGITGFARFVYLNRRYVKLYSGLGMGLGISMDQFTAPEYKGSSASLQFNFAATLFGVRAGGKVYGLVELNAGTLGLFTAGIGFELGK